MADEEFTRLKAQQDSAFSEQQRSFEVVRRAKEEASRLYNIAQLAWQKRSAARDEMNREFQRMKESSTRNDVIWDEYKRVRDYNNSQITSLKYQADQTYSNMQNAFQNASNAFNYGNKAAAPGYSAEGKRYKSQLQSLNSQIKQLGSEVKAAKARAQMASGGRASADTFKSAKSRFELAKSQHEAAQANFKSAKAIADRAKADFDRAKAVHQAAKDVFKSYLEKAKAKKKERQQSDWDLMERAKIPYSYRTDCKVRRESDGTVNFYFGGIGGKDGYGHAHVSMDKKGEITYNRKVFEDHGAHNFTNFEKQVANEKRRTGFEDGKYDVKVDPYDGLVRTHYYFGGINENDKAGHGHIAIDELGENRFIRDAFSPNMPNAKKDAVIFDDRIHKKNGDK